MTRRSSTTSSSSRAHLLTTRGFSGSFERDHDATFRAVFQDCVDVVPHAQGVVGKAVGAIVDQVVGPMAAHGVCLAATPDRCDDAIERRQVAHHHRTDRSRCADHDAVVSSSDDAHLDGALATQAPIVVATDW
jgi:hypothetical protein